MANIKIFVGSVYGNALDVAIQSADFLQQQGHEVQIYREPQRNDLLAAESDVILVCTSTTGQGEIPDNLMLFYCQLQDNPEPFPELRYSVIALGDSGYETFAEAGVLMDAVLQQRELKQLSEPLFIDACKTQEPAEDALSWLQQWQKLL